MKGRNFKQLVVLLAFAATIGTMTSCQRGYGCPNNFSIETVAAQVISTVAAAIVQE